jgi:hypothetical protein
MSAAINEDPADNLVGVKSASWVSLFPCASTLICCA